ncbi:MAG: hypothetical protein IJ181_02810 [Acidaminococcaceae bacterium]|nr:hypothetical protein [Acidaminococcaceae bacterium]
MTARQIVEMALAYKDMDKATLAGKLGWSPQLLNKRLNTGKFSVEEWQAIGTALEAPVQINFCFPDGQTVGLNK